MRQFTIVTMQAARPPNKKELFVRSLAPSKANSVRFLNNKLHVN